MLQTIVFVAIWEIFVSGTDEQPRSLRLLGLAIEQARRRRNMDVQELAGASGVGADRIVALEAGCLDPDFELLLKLADALGVPSAALIVHAEALGSPRAGIDIGPPPG